MISNFDGCVRPRARTHAKSDEHRLLDASFDLAKAGQLGLVL
jgi:hypothetical protein